MILENVKLKLYDIFEEPTGLDTKIANVFLTILIALNVLAVILDTVDPIKQQYGVWFTWFEHFSIIIFTIEYLMRLWIADIDPVHGKESHRRLKHILSPSAIIDLLVLLPYYLPLVMPNFMMLRMLRFFRIFRVLKLGRYSNSARILSDVFRAKKEALLVTLATALMVLLFSAGALYYAEHDAQPDKFPSIPESLWVAAITLTSVGYGDAYPITSLGKVAGGIIAFSGIGLFALPAGILASGFADAIAMEKEREERAEMKKEIANLELEVQGTKEHYKYCPHCGKQL